MFTAADHPLRARQVCEVMDLTVAPHNINNVRLQLKRLTGRGSLAETEQGLFTQPRPWPPGDFAASLLTPPERAKRT
ncbi:hypothetical protein [Streptomyces sp. BA2]|uniref:hypothetical protein n=1 Tax=Streptomyces sp. BA2 TaxID=436595 RepID=UPI00132C209F|nr:hypothetical protein [Streptomyces sp. BA2]MWA08210.1 hypothetical protein [Streptomyces sp. BA2]